MNYVQLDRRFSDVLDSDDEAEKQDISARFFGPEHSSDSWDKVLESRLVVVLGEAGSGKTTELREQARRLRLAGRVGIFIRLESFLDGPIDTAVDAEGDASNTAAFDAWQRNPGPATFFLDSVDEARLRGPRRFNDALASFSRAVASSGAGVSVVLSCRPNDWQYRTDLESVSSRLSWLLKRKEQHPADPAPGTPDDTPIETAAITAAEGDADPKAVRVVSLNALSRADVTALLTARDVPDLDGLLTALDYADAWDQARRPRDIEWLAALWRKDRRLGSLSELIEAGVAGMLVERNPAHRAGPALSAERARQGAERLAAAAIFCRQPSIRVPDEELGGDAERPALNAAEVLPDWEDSEIQALLGRALFDEASAGRVRFHHRTAAAYLAAQWLCGLVHKHGCPPANALDLLIGEAVGEKWPVLDRLEMAAWVATDDAALRRAILGVVPDLLLGFGDAARIKPDERASQIKPIVAHYSDGHRPEWFLSEADYRRFAAPAVTAAAVSALREGGLSDSLTRTLLWLGAEHPSAELGEAALEIVRDVARSDSIRRSAIEVVGRSGTSEQKLALKTYVLTSEANAGFLAELTNALLPDNLTVDELADQLEKASPEALDDSAGLGFRWVSDVVERCSPPHLMQLVRRLHRMVTEPPHLRGQTHTRRISKQYGHLVPLLACCLEGLAPAADQLDDLALDEIVQSALVCRDAEETIGALARDYDSLAEILSRSATLRRAILCQFVLDRFTDPNEMPPWLWGPTRVVDLQPGDGIWLSEKARLAGCEGDRFAFLRAAAEIWRFEDKGEVQRLQLRQQVEESALPTKMKEDVLATLAPIAAPKGRPTQPSTLQAESRDRAEAERIARSRDALTAELRLLENGRGYSGLQFLVREMGRLPGHTSTSWTQSNFSALAAAYGNHIVDAFRAGLCAFWNTWCPLLPGERSDDGQMAYATIVGLTGLGVLASESDKWTAPNAGDVQIAARYALNEMNGFPGWLDGLADRNPDQVREVVLKEVFAQLDRIKGEHGSQFLRNVARRPLIARTVAEPLLEHLERTRTTLASAVVAEALDIVRAGGFGDGSRVCALAAARAKALWAGSGTCALTWWAEWFRHAPSDAWNFVEGRIPEEPDDVARALVVRVLMLVAPEGADPETLPPGLDVTTLGRMLPVLHRHRPTDANPGKVADVSIRWRIDNAFGVLCKKLERIPSAEAHRVLKELSKDPDMADLAPSFASGVHRHAQNVVAGSAWSPAQVVEFSREFETEPRTPREVHRLVVNRLLRMKVDMEDGDSGERGHFLPGDPEKKYQRYVAARLRETLRIGPFVSREDEVADDKKLDIRVAMPAGRTTIEVKPLDNESAKYSYTALCSTIEVQLIGQYMRDADSRFGILLLFLAEQKRFRVDGIQVSFESLLVALQAFANDLVERRPDVDGLTVVGIDCTPWVKIKPERTQKSPAKPKSRRGRTVK